LRIGFLGLQDAAAECVPFQLRAEKHPIDAVFLRPLRARHRVDLVEQFPDVLGALGDLCRGIIGQPVVPGVKPGIAAVNGEVLIAPGVKFICDLPERGDVRAGFGSRGRLRQQRLIRNVGLGVWRGLGKQARGDE
jgi:hypothetical protein